MSLQLADEPFLSGDEPILGECASQVFGELEIGELEFQWNQFMTSNHIQKTEEIKA